MKSRNFNIEIPLQKHSMRLEIEYLIILLRSLN